MRIYLSAILLFLNPILTPQSLGNDLNVEEITLILRRLAEATGDQRKELPRVEISTEKRFAASYRKSVNTIVIEETVVDICRNFGSQSANAMAFLLGHELTHFYQEHDWRQAGVSTSFIAAQDVFATHIHEEKEADTYSAFICHQAGYPTVDVIPVLLNEIYRSYRLDDQQLSTYPALDQRRQVAAEVCKTIQDLIRVYTAGNYLSAVGQLEGAGACYSYLLTYIKCKELYNNLGLVNLRSAIAMPVAGQLPFQYPVSLSTDIPLRTPAGFTRQDLLAISINALVQATKYDNSFFAGYLNLVCAYHLQNREQLAEDLLIRLRGLADTDSELARWQIMKGIVETRKGDLLLARSHFTEALAGNDLASRFLAQQNLDVLDGKYQPILPHLQTRINDRIDGIDLLFYQERSPDQKHRINLNQNPFNDQSLAISQLPNSSIFSFSSGNSLCKLQLTRAPFGTAGTEDQLLQQFPDQKSTAILHSSGHFLIIPERGLIFNIDQQGKLVEWGIFIG